MFNVVAGKGVTGSNEGPCVSAPFPDEEAKDSDKAEGLKTDPQSLVHMSHSLQGEADTKLGTVEIDNSGMNTWVTQNLFLMD